MFRSLHNKVSLHQYVFKMFKEENQKELQYKILFVPSSKTQPISVIRAHLANAVWEIDRLCGLVVKVSGYRYRGLGFDSRRYQISWVVVGLERGPLSLVRSIEELLE